MEVFVKQLQRWMEVTDENKELLIKFGALKKAEHDTQDSKGGKQSNSGDAKRTRKSRKSI